MTRADTGSPAQRRMSGDQRRRRDRHRLRHDGLVDVSEMQAYCLGKPGAWPDNPWGHEHPVIKVHEKIFAFLGAGGVGVKGGVNRDVADEWLKRFPDDASVMAYIGRSGWNDLAFGGAIPDDELLEAVDESYRLVVSKLPKKHRPAGWDS